MTVRLVRVLYVDDDPALARLVERRLSRRGYAVEHAPTSEEGLERVRQGGIDVIALDHYLPGCTGLDLLAALAAIPDPPPVVYVTGSAETAVAVAALKAGAFDYVPKTVTDEFQELLVEAIEQALDKARLKRERDRAEREMRAAKERAEVLLGEVNHRVANSLALVASMVGMQARTSTEPTVREALSEMQARISAIAGIHRRLYTSDDVRFVDLGDYLTSLIDDLKVSMRNLGRGARVLVEVENLRVPTDKAVSLGVILAELVTNAFKYAYPDRHDGEVRVRLAAVAAGRAQLSVEDDGVGWTGEGKIQGTGLGSRIVKAMAASLASAVQYERLPVGTRASLTFDH